MSQEVSERWLICRICLKDGSNKLYNIFEPIDDEELSDLGTTLLDKIELFGAIEVNQEYNLPNKICNRCVLLLRAAYKFRDLCQQSQIQLKQFITVIPQKEETNEAIEINFDSDAEEQRNEVQEETDNGILDEDYVVEEGVEEYDGTTQEPEQNLIDQNYDIIASMEEDNMEIQQLSNDGNSEYFVEEVDYKGFNSEEDGYEMTNFKCEEDPIDDSIIIEENAKNTCSQIISKSSIKTKTTAKRKRKYSPVEKINGYYSCIYCDNSYTDKTKYNNHMKIHIQDKPHECEICNKRFTTTPQLSRHMNSHTGNRPYKCQYCVASFGDPSTKIKHERIHTNERPYKCFLCNKAFGYSNVLKVHMMTHTGEKPHGCEFCGRAFSQLHHKNAHEKRHSKANMVMVQNSPDENLIIEEI